MSRIPGESDESAAGLLLSAHASIDRTLCVGAPHFAKAWEVTLAAQFCNQGDFAYTK